MTPQEIAEALSAEFVIQDRAGGNDATVEAVAAFIACELRRGPTLWGYYTNGGRKFCTTPDRAWANLNADGFKWENPRVRRVGIVESISDSKPRPPNPNARSAVSSAPAIGDFPMRL